MTQIETKLDKGIIEDVKKLYKKMDNSKEFELIFFSKNLKKQHFSMEKYVNLLKIFNARNKLEKLHLESNLTTLDIIYSPDKETNYRCTINGSDAINLYMAKFTSIKSNKHVIFKQLANFAKEKKDENITCEKKVKSSESTIDVDDLNMRVRLSDELELTKKDFEMIEKMNHSDMNKIIYRLKKRTSLYVMKTKDDYIKIDTTKTNTNDNYDYLQSSPPRYELEIETKSDKPKDEYLKKMFEECDKLLKILQQSNFIITNTEVDKVIEKYRILLNVPNNQTYTQSLYGRQPVSLEIQYVETLVNKYAITDKADGERHFLMIIDKQVYLMNKNLEVRDTGITISKEKYDGSVLDGELILIKGRYTYLAFDCLRIGDNDVRKITNLSERLKYADEIIDECFILKGQKGYKYGKLEQKSYDLDKILDFHKKEITNMFKNYNEDLEAEKKYPLVRRKYFIHATGSSNWEIFAYSNLIWNLYTTEGSNIKCPYILDGLIFQPNEQQYIVEKKDSKFKDYKWKPLDKNSIDFYIEFAKNGDGDITNVYDNSYADLEDNDEVDNDTVERRARNQLYRICYLFVGRQNGKIQEPVQFIPEEELHVAYLPIVNGEVRDQKGNLLIDKTVCEFYYNVSESTPKKFRWKPIRTRFDKSEMVTNYKVQYGNYIDVAHNTWKSIKNPVQMTDFAELSKGNKFYDIKMKELRGKIDHSLVLSAVREDAYNQIVSNLAKPMRAVHNRIKDNLIYTYCHSMYSGKTKKILDIGVGKGQDIMKYYYAKVDSVVGIDYDKDALSFPLDGAISRYNKQKNKPGFPKMFFIHGDFNALFDYESQEKSIGGMDDTNRKLMKQFFSTDADKRQQYDVMNAGFSIHYGFRDGETFKNLKTNIKNYLKNDGYLLITTFDAHKVMELLGDKQNYKQEYTNENGEVKTLFEIVKKYQDVDSKATLGTGHTIDVFMGWFMIEGSYHPEYLVDEKFIVEEFKKDCDLELVSSDYFNNQYYIDSDFIQEYSNYEHNSETLKNFGKIAKYYEDDEINRGCKIYTNLEKFYVFHKNEKSKEKKGGSRIDGKKFFIDMDDKITKDEHSFMRSITKILKLHSLIPKSDTVKSFCKMIGVKKVSDEDIDDDYIESVCEKLNVNHENSDEDVKNIIDGIKIIIGSQNDESYDTDKYGKRCQNKKAPYLFLIKNGNKYNPVYRIEDEEYNGLMDENDIEEIL